MSLRTIILRTSPRLTCLAALGLALLLPAAAGAQPPFGKQGPKGGGGGDLEKKLDQLIRDVEQIKKQMGQTRTDAAKSPEAVDRARADVKKDTAEVKKLQEQLTEARRKLQQDQVKLNELEGKKQSPYTMRRWGGYGGPGFGGGFGPGSGATPSTPQSRDIRTGDDQQKLNQLLQQVEELLREMKRAKR